MSCLITTCNISLFKDLFALIRDISKEIRKPGSLEKFSLYFTARRRSLTSCFLLSWFQFSFSYIRFRCLMLWLHRTYYCCAGNLCFSSCPVSVVCPGLWAPQLTLKRREAVFQVFYTFAFMFAWFFFLLSQCPSFVCRSLSDAVWQLLWLKLLLLCRAAQFRRRRVSAFMATIFALVCRALFGRRRVSAFIAKIFPRVSSTVWQTPCVGFYS